MAALTPTELARWQAAYTAKREARRVQCQSPVTPANPITPRTPGQHLGTLRPRVR